MPTAARLLLACSLTLALASCRQADGPAPMPNSDQNNEIGDIARDMINVANKDPQAPEDLRSDLSKYGETPEATTKINELAKEITDGIGGTRLDEKSAQNLAQTLWTGLNGKQLSERQVNALGREVKVALASTGVAEDRAQSIADRLSAAQKTVSSNPRRWYQVF